MNPIFKERFDPLNSFDGMDIKELLPEVSGWEEVPQQNQIAIKRVKVLLSNLNIPYSVEAHYQAARIFSSYLQLQPYKVEFVNRDCEMLNRWLAARVENDHILGMWDIYEQLEQRSTPSHSGAQMILWLFELYLEKNGFATYADYERAVLDWDKKRNSEAHRAPTPA